MTYVDFNQLSNWGLIYKINKEILHPLGLALTRNPKDGTSEGCVVDESGDLLWEFSKDITDRNEEKLQYFLDNRAEILNYFIEKVRIYYLIN